MNRGLSVDGLRNDSAVHVVQEILRILQQSIVLVVAEPIAGWKLQRWN